MNRLPSSQAPRERLLAVFRVEPAELWPTLLLGVVLMLGMASVICLKAVSDAVFLSEFDASRLPYVDLAVTAVAGLGVNYYLRWSSRTSLGALITSTQGFLALNLLVFWTLLTAGQGAWVPPLIYVCVGVFAALIPSQVWLLAAAVFTTRQAKRLFSLVGAGGILGAALGGTFAGLFGRALGAENLLPPIAALLGCSALLVRPLTRLTAAPASVESGAEKLPILDSMRLIGGNRYLRLIASAVFVSAIAGALVKYQFKAAAQIHFDGDLDELAAFSGYFYGYISVASFLFHVLLTGRLLRGAGLNGCLLILPLSLLAGELALLLSAALAAAVFARAVDQGFRHSIDRAAMELLHVPAPAAIRARVKSVLDMVVSRSADGIASLVLLGLIGAFGASVRQIGWAGLAFIGLWLFVLWRLRREYVRTLRQTIERPGAKSGALLETLVGAGPAERLESGLRSSDQRDIEAALGWLQYTGTSAAHAHLATLLTHESPSIRRKAMAVVAAHESPGFEGEALRFLELESDAALRWQAFGYLESQDFAEALGTEADLLDSEEPELAALAAARLLHASSAFRPRASEVFERFVEDASRGAPPRRAAAARLLGLAPPTDRSRQDLALFLEDDDPGVVRAALTSAASLGSTARAPLLIRFLDDKRFAREAREALVALGASAVEPLGEALRSEDSSAALQRQAARTLAAVDGPAAVRPLLAYLRRPRQAARTEVLRALARIRSRDPQLRFDREIVNLLVHLALRRFYQTAALLAGLDRDSSESNEFLRRALRESMRRWLDEIFTLLSLTYPAREIQDAAYRLHSGRADLRANAIEFLDSRLFGNSIRPALLPALEEQDPERLAGAGRELFDLQALPYSSILSRLIETPDPWLQACACHAAGLGRVAELEARIAALAESSSDALLRETAAVAATRLRSEPAPVTWSN